MKNNLKRLNKSKNNKKSKENKLLRHFKKESKPFKLNMNKPVKTKSKNTEKIKRTFFILFLSLKHEVMKLEPHLIASESLYDAQLKKKAIEIEIQMTTLKQKIEMMDNFKGMKAETLDKI